ncbi:RNA-directed DNA polymerase, eukaryota, reverse transcriptase zinc-binding domain protein [Tanacetum coccineum]
MKVVDITFLFPWPLESTSKEEIYEAGLSIDITIAELVTFCEGNWPEGWANEYPVLNYLVFPSIQDGIKDETVWVDKNGKERPFSVKYVWKDLNCDESKVEWYKIVWFNKYILRHAFVLWMAIQNRLSTQDRVAVWKTNELQRLLSVSMSFSWRNIVEELQRLPNNNNIWRIVKKLMFGAVVYYIWQERNNRVFREEKRDEKTLVQAIKEIIQLRITGFEMKESKAVREVEARWNV